jgi:hypothetical protein
MRCQFSRRCHIYIAIQRVADVIWVLLLHAHKGKIRKPLRRLDVELACVLGGSSHRQEEERDAQGQFHRLIL